MKNISKRKFLVILAASVIFGVCSSSVNNGKISSSGRQPELKDWVNQGVNAIG